MALQKTSRSSACKDGQLQSRELSPSALGSIVIYFKQAEHLQMRHVKASSCFQSTRSHGLQHRLPGSESPSVNGDGDIAYLFYVQGTTMDNSIAYTLQA